MIKYALGCDNDHEFEGWFSDSDEFDRLSGGGHLDCPVCGSTTISKLLMAPSVKTTKGKNAGEIVPVAAPEPKGSQVAPQMPGAAPGGNVPLAASSTLPAIPPEVQEKVIEHFREIRQHVLENSENVGDNFAEEARKIHYGESEQRGIFGNATPQDASELLEEGVEILPLPVLPEDQN